jgi:hypothetical protein
MLQRIPRTTLLLILALAVCTVPALGQSTTTYPITQRWLQTPAERADYQDGGTLYEPLMEFVYELESRTELMNVVKLTETLMGRDVVLAVLSNPPVFKPQDLTYSDKPVVLIVNNVHGGEVAGKDAAMEIMRDLVMGDLRPLLDDVVVLVVPTINPDGAEVRRRTNEEGFDMNRDYIKLESQEIQALVTKVLNDWNPHIHVDTHHGGAAPYALTFQTNMNPAGDPNIMAMGNEQILPRVRAALRAENYDGFWYSGPGNVGGARQHRRLSLRDPERLAPCRRQRHAGRTHPRRRSLPSPGARPVHRPARADSLCGGAPRRAHGGRLECPQRCNCARQRRRRR